MAYALKVYFEMPRLKKASKKMKKDKCPSKQH
jgi:hypothetical protein